MTPELPGGLATELIAAIDEPDLLAADVHIPVATTVTIKVEADTDGITLVPETTTPGHGILRMLGIAVEAIGPAVGVCPRADTYVPVVIPSSKGLHGHPGLKE